MKKKKLIAALLVAALAAAGFVWMKVSGNARNAARYTEGVEALESGRYAEAMDAFGDLKYRSCEDAEELYLRAAEGRAGEMEAAGDWEGALELLRLAGGKGSYDVVLRWAGSMAAEGRMDDAMALLEERIDGRDPFYLNRAKGRVMMSVGQYAEAEAHFREMIETGGRESELAEDLLECVYRQYLAAEAAGDEAEMEALEGRAMAPGGEEPDQYVYIRLGRARRCAGRGDYAGAAEALEKWRSGGMKATCPKTAAAAEALVDDIFSACVWDGEWAALYAAFPEDFERRALADEALAAPYYLASTGRAALIGTDPDFNALADALPADADRDGESLFRDLAAASGDPAEQFAAARERARGQGLEYALMSTALDISAAAAAGQAPPVAVTPELLAALPAAAERPGTGEKAVAAAAFREAYGPEADFRASEPRPGYYAVLAADGCKRTPFEPFSDDPRQAGFDLERLETDAGGILGVLSRVGGGAYRYRAVENPNTAALLVVLHSDYQLEGAGYRLANLVHPDEGKSYAGYAQVIRYTIHDARAGGIVASGEVRAEIPDDVRTANVEDGAFWVNVDENDMHTDMEGARELRAATDAAAAEFCGR